MNLVACGNVWIRYVLRDSLQNVHVGGNWRAGNQFQPMQNFLLSLATLLRSRAKDLEIFGNESYNFWVLFHLKFLRR